VPQPVNRARLPPNQDRNEPIKRGRCCKDAQNRGWASRQVVTRGVLVATHIRLRADKEETVPGAGHRDIQHAQFLRPGALLYFEGRLPMGCGGVLDHPFGVDDAQADPRFSLEDEPAATIAEVEPRADPGHEHHGELQALSLMDAHDPDDVLGFADGWRRGHVPFVILEGLHEPQESMEALPAERREMPGKLMEP